MINGAEVSSRRAVSSPDGSFEVRALEAGDYELTVKNERGQTMRWASSAKNANAAAASAPMKITIAEREQKTGVALTVEIQNAVIRGRVLGPDGTPVADAFVTATPSLEFRAPPPGARPGPRRASSDDSSRDDDGEDEDEESSEMMMVVSTDGPGSAGGFSRELPPVVTDADGRFAITGLRRGEYDLVAEGLKGTARAFADKVETGKDVSIKLKGLTILEGIVTRDGKPVPRFTISLRGPTTLSREYSDEAGTFTVRRLDPGKYTVSASGDGGEAETTIEVTEGEKTQVEIPLQVQLKVAGKLIDAEGKPIDKAMVILTPDRGDGEVSIQIGGNGPPIMTDATGAFEISTLPGAFTLIAIKPSQGPLAMRPINVTKDMDLGEITADGGRPPE